MKFASSADGVFGVKLYGEMGGKVQVRGWWELPIFIRLIRLGDMHV